MKSQQYQIISTVFVIDEVHPKPSTWVWDLLFFGWIYRHCGFLEFIMISVQMFLFRMKCLVIYKEEGVFGGYYLSWRVPSQSEMPSRCERWGSNSEIPADLVQCSPSPMLLFSFGIPQFLPKLNLLQGNPLFMHKAQYTVLLPCIVHVHFMYRCMVFPEIAATSAISTQYSLLKQGGWTCCDTREAFFLITFCPVSLHAAY